MKSLKKMRAFTLIELIVVIVIIGILLALAAVGYLSFVNNSNKKASFASAKQAATIIQGLSSTSQTKATSLAAGSVVSGDGVTVLAGAPNSADGVLMVKTSAVVGTGGAAAANGDLVVCSYKGSQVSSITFSVADAAGSPPAKTGDASATGTISAACPAYNAAALVANTAANNV